jgi:hypothetical protein
MKKTFVVALATTLLSTVALAGERQVTVELPKTITVTCSDRVSPGTVVLTNPPKFSCADYDVVKRVIGTGITIGPDARVSSIIRAVRRVEKPRRPLTMAEVRQNERNTQLVNRSKREIERDNGWKDVRMPVLTSQRPSNGNWRDINQTDNRPPSYWQDGYRKGAWQPLDDFDKRFPGMNRNRAWFEKSEGTNCTGYVNINDLLNGKCKNARVRVD